MNLQDTQNRVGEALDLVAAIQMMALTMHEEEASAMRTVGQIARDKLGEVYLILDEWRAAVDGGQDPFLFKEAAE